MPQVFGCPYCQNPFQVPDDAAGQRYECPSCDTLVEVPDAPEPVVEVQQPEPEIYRCPHCNDQFAIESSMYGEKLSCPHCENLIMIEAPPAPTPTPPVQQETVAAEVEPESSTFAVVDLPASKPSSAKSKETPSSTSAAKGESKLKPTQPKSKKQKSKSTKQKSKPKKPTTDPAPPTTKPSSPKAPKVETTSPASQSKAAATDPKPAFQPMSVAHLLPPTFNVFDPVRFPPKRGSSDVILPDGEGGYRKVDANIVTITHNGQVYHLQRLSPEERRRRMLIHNTIGISIAILLIYLTLQTVGFFS